MAKYRYTGSGILSFFVDTEQVTVAKEGHPTLPNVVELNRKLTKEQLKATGLVPLEKDPKEKK